MGGGPEETLSERATDKISARLFFVVSIADEGTVYSIQVQEESEQEMKTTQHRSK